MKALTIVLFFLATVSTYSQEWIIVDILEQSKKELVYKFDNGEEVKRETVKNPSIVKLIKDYQAKGFQWLGFIRNRPLDPSLLVETKI